MNKKLISAKLMGEELISGFQVEPNTVLGQKRKVLNREAEVQGRVHARVGDRTPRGLGQGYGRGWEAASRSLSITAACQKSSKPTLLAHEHLSSNIFSFGRGRIFPHTNGEKGRGRWRQPDCRPGGVDSNREDRTAIFNKQQLRFLTVNQLS